jgi:hypothetical protein
MAEEMTEANGKRELSAGRHGGHKFTVCAHPKREGSMAPNRTAGNASSSLFEPSVTHRMPTDTKIGLRVCNGCGSPFRPKRFWQKQCSARCRQRAYVRRQPIKTVFYYGA